MSVVENIEYKVGQFSLNIKKWEIPDEGLSLLTGESGSGKSTLIDLLVGFKKSPSMSWIFKGQDFCKLKIQNKKIGLVMQKGELFPHLTGRQCIDFAAQSRGLVKYHHQRDTIVAKLNLDDELLNQSTVTLSGGERQRIALICALIGEPNIILIDEGFSALDSINKDKAFSLLLEVCCERKIPALIVSHDDSLKDKPFRSHFRLENGNIAT